MGLDMTVISLCDRTGHMVRPWAEAGFECWCVDTQHSIRRTRTEQVGAGLIHYEWGDVRSYRRPTTKPIAFMMVQTPCTHTAVSGARDFAKKRGMMLRDALEMFEAGGQVADWSGAPYCQENPVVTLSSVPHIGNPFRVGGYFKIGGGERHGGFSWLEAHKDYADATFNLIESNEQAVSFFRLYRRLYPYKPEELAPLRGKNLACWCDLSSPCHADVLLELANKDQP